MEASILKEPILYKILRPLMKTYTKLIFHPKIVGLEFIPKTDSVILAGNHTSYNDWLPLISSTKRVVHFLAKDSLFKGIKKILFKNVGAIPVNRSIHDKNALKSAEKILQNGGVIAIFPEGTINRTKEVIMPFKIGAVKMAYDTNTPIIPFSITGKFKMFKNDLTITFYEPLKVETKDLDEANDKLAKIIANGLERIKK